MVQYFRFDSVIFFIPIMSSSSFFSLRFWLVVCLALWAEFWSCGFSTITNSKIEHRGMPWFVLKKAPSCPSLRVYPKHGA